MFFHGNGILLQIQHLGVLNASGQYQECESIYLARADPNRQTE
jgi:hypothetical protein